MHSLGTRRGPCGDSTTAARPCTKRCAPNTWSARPQWVIFVSLKTRTLSIDPNEPDPVAIAEAAAVLRRGDLVAFATETVYGLGADATHPGAVARIFAAKGRPAANPLIVHASGIAMAQTCVSAWTLAAG